MCKDLVCMLSPEPEEGFCADFCVHSDIWSCLKEVGSVQVFLELRFIEKKTKTRKQGKNPESRFCGEETCAQSIRSTARTRSGKDLRKRE